jgi:hypothetical protein
MLRIYSSLFTFFLFFYFLKKWILIYLNFNQQNNVIFKNFLHQSAQNLFQSFYKKIPDFIYFLKRIKFEFLNYVHFE